MSFRKIAVGLLALTACLSMAQAEMIFNDGFEDAYSNGLGGPNWIIEDTTWNPGTFKVTDSNAAIAAVEGGKYMRFNSPQPAGAYATTIMVNLGGQVYNTIVIEAYLRIDNGTGKGNAVVQVGKGVLNWGTMTFYGKSSGSTYWIRRNDGPNLEELVTTGPQTLKWHKWTWVINITNPTTGEGTYSLIKDDGLATRFVYRDNVSVAPMAVGVNAIDTVTFYGKGYCLDRVRIYTTYQQPTVPSCGDLTTTYNKGDLNRDCHVNFKDVENFAGQWIKCTDPVNTSCTPLI